MKGSVRDSAILCKQAAVQIAELSTDAKNALLRAMADALEAQAATILAANAEDMTAAREKGIGEAMLDRLALDDGRVRGTSVLDPNWISNGVYTILTNPLPQTQKGILRRRQLRTILPAAYPPDTHDFLLQMMLKFELAYMLDYDSVLIPDLIAEEEPVYEWDDGHALQFEYQYEVLRRSTLHRLMVRRHNWINPAAVWRTGVMLQRDGLSALIRADIEAKTIRIAINGEGNGGAKDRRQFLYALRLEFADIHDSIKGTKPQEVVPIPGHPQVKPPTYAHLIKLEKLNQPDLQLFEGMDDLFSVQKLLNGVTTAAMRQEEPSPRQSHGNVTYNISGDLIHGDKPAGDKVGGNKNTVESITASTVDIGRKG